MTLSRWKVRNNLDINTKIIHINKRKMRASRWRWRRRWHPTPVLLPGKYHGRRSLEGCSPWGHWESDTTERLRFHFSLSCIGEGNGNPLQCSCLENPRDGGAWWAVIYGVTQSRTWLKWLSSSSRWRWIGIGFSVVIFLTRLLLTQDMKKVKEKPDAYMQNRGPSRRKSKHNVRAGLSVWRIVKRYAWLESRQWGQDFVGYWMPSKKQSFLCTLCK